MYIGMLRARCSLLQRRASDASDASHRTHCCAAERIVRGAVIDGYRSLLPDFSAATVSAIRFARVSGRFAPSIQRMKFLR